jgi:hypothetical protein
MPPLEMWGATVECLEVALAVELEEKRAHGWG